MMLGCAVIPAVSIADIRGSLLTLLFWISAGLSPPIYDAPMVKNPVYDDLSDCVMIFFWVAWDRRVREWTKTAELLWFRNYKFRNGVLLNDRR
jgi:hypothetical protein